jgi:hypothetical protein
MPGAFCFALETNPRRPQTHFVLLTYEAELV